MADRKYRQHGYQDRNEKPQRESSAKPEARETFGPRPMQMAGSRDVSRCAQCGALLELQSVSVQCPKCGFQLHSCRQCSYFDTSKRFECMQLVPVRIPRKDERNDCTFYSISVRVEKETSTPAAQRPNDARQAFEALFKK